MKDFDCFSVPAAGSKAKELLYNVGACCGDIHDGILLDGGGGQIVISLKSFELIKLCVDEYYHQRCPKCGGGHKR